MAVPATVFRTALEPVDETDQLSDSFFVSLFALFGACQCGVAQDSSLTIAACPGDQRRWTCRKKVHPIERAMLFIEFNHAAFDPVVAHIAAIQVKIERGLQFAGMRAATGKG